MSPKPSLQALNYLWIAINYPTTETILKGREAACPIPETYIDNIAATAAANPNVDVYLWIDKRRHTDQELAALSARVKSCQTSDNIQIRDLCEIPEYHCRFFAQAETSPSWRTNKHSLIWRQVDAAKFLVCFQGGYEQAFFADMDLVNISISSEAAQKPITSHGWVVGVREMPDDKLAFENQFFGFTSRQKPIFKRAYDIAIKEVWLNGYECLLFQVQTELKETGLGLGNVGYKLEGGLQICSYHPTRQNSHGSADEQTFHYPTSKVYTAYNDPNNSTALPTFLQLLKIPPIKQK